MKKTLTTLALACLAGCTGSVTVDENPGSLQNDGMTIGTTSTSSQTASTTTESTTETVTTEPPVDVVELIVTQQPIEGNLKSGTAHLMEFDFYAPNHSVQVDLTPFTIGSTNGEGFVSGFAFNQVIDVIVGNLYAGPKDVDAQDAHSTDVDFTDSFVVDKGETIKMAFTSYLAGLEQKDPGFANHDFLIQLHIKGIKGKVVETGLPLTPGNISPESDLTQTFHTPSE